MLYNTFDREHNYKHSNIVFFSAFISYIFLIPFFYIIAGYIISIVYVFCMIISFASYVLNRKGKISSSLFIFVLAMNFSTLISTFAFGSTSGFFYYFFNMSVLISFSSWKNKNKLIAIIIELLLFISLYYFTFDYIPYYNISNGLLITIHFINVVFNLIGVSNSAFYYVKIAKKYQLALTKVAETDYLTEIWNRSVFDKTYNQIIKSNINVCLMLVDIDDFKQINDNFGHSYGDQVLKLISQVIIKNTNDKAIISRYGGEEFSVIMYTDDGKTAYDVAEKIRIEIQELNYKINENEIVTTVSIGVLFKKQNNDYCAFDLLNETDKLLYEAKKTGKNRVVYKEI